VSFLGPVFDRQLGRLVSRSMRRGLAGEPIWLAVGAAAWLVVRSRRKDKPIVWSGVLGEGERLILINRSAGEPDTSQPG
jgi:hypothetical protein